MPSPIIIFQLIYCSRAQQFGPSSSCGITQPLLETGAVEMPAVAVRVAQEVKLLYFRTTPQRAIAIPRLMSLCKETLQQPHISQQSPGCRDERFTDARRNVFPAFDQHNAPQRRKVYSNCGTGRPSPDNQNIYLAHLNASAHTGNDAPSRYLSGPH